MAVAADHRHSLACSYLLSRAAEMAFQRIPQGQIPCRIAQSDGTCTLDLPEAMAETLRDQACELLHAEPRIGVPVGELGFADLLVPLPQLVARRAADTEGLDLLVEPGELLLGVVEVAQRPVHHIVERVNALRAQLNNPQTWIAVGFDPGPLQQLFGNTSAIRVFRLDRDFEDWAAIESKCFDRGDTLALAPA